MTNFIKIEITLFFKAVNGSELRCLDLVSWNWSKTITFSQILAFYELYVIFWKLQLTLFTNIHRAFPNHCTTLLLLHNNKYYHICFNIIRAFYDFSFRLFCEHWIQILCVIFENMAQKCIFYCNFQQVQKQDNIFKWFCKIPP